MISSNYSFTNSEKSNKQQIFLEDNINLEENININIDNKILNLQINNNNSENHITYDELHENKVEKLKFDNYSQYFMQINELIAFKSDIKKIYKKFLLLKSQVFQMHEKCSITFIQIDELVDRFYRLDKKFFKTQKNLIEIMKKEMIYYEADLQNIIKEKKEYKEKSIFSKIYYFNPILLLQRFKCRKANIDFDEKHKRYLEDQRIQEYYTYYFKQFNLVKNLQQKIPNVIRIIDKLSDDVIVLENNLLSVNFKQFKIIYLIIQNLSIFEENYPISLEEIINTIDIAKEQLSGEILNIYKELEMLFDKFNGVEKEYIEYNDNYQNSFKYFKSEETRVRKLNNNLDQLK